MKRLAKAVVFLISALSSAGLALGGKGHATEVVYWATPSNAPRQEWVEKVERARQRYEAFALQVTTASHLPSGDASKMPPSSDASYLSDATLRRGDVVVTSRALLIFKGSVGFPFKKTDFERMGQSRTLSLAHQADLLEIQRVGSILAPHASEQ